jgi:hypothetical protein
MATIGGLFGIVLALAATIFTGHWILRPLAKEARWLNLPTRFTLSDFVWLLVLLQIVLAAVVAIAPPDLENAVPLTGLLVFFGGSATLLWVFGISALSKAGITQPLRRGVFTVFLLPAVLLLLMATGIGFGAVLTVLLHPLVDTAPSRRGSVFATAWGGSAIGFMAWALITWMLRKVAEWVLGPNRAELRPPNETERLPPDPPASDGRKPAGLAPNDERSM